MDCSGSSRLDSVAIAQFQLSIGNVTVSVEVTSGSAGPFDAVDAFDPAQVSNYRLQERNAIER